MGQKEMAMTGKNQIIGPKTDGTMDSSGLDKFS
jgi:hypothetical protein